MLLRVEIAAHSHSHIACEMKYIVVEAALPNMNSRKRLVHASTSSPRPTRVSRQVEEHTGLFEENYTLSLETRPPIDASMQIVRGRIG